MSNDDPGRRIRKLLRYAPLMTDEQVLEAVAAATDPREKQLATREAKKRNLKIEAETP